MKNTEKNRETLRKMHTRCEYSRWELVYHESEQEHIFPELRVREDAPKYTPEVYLETDWYGREQVTIRISTTSYGSMNSSEIGQVAAGLAEAARLAEDLNTLARLGGLEVRP